MGQLILTCDALVIVIRNGSVSVENKKIRDLENIFASKARKGDDNVIAASTSVMCCISTDCINTCNNSL